MVRKQYRIETASMPSEQHPDRNEDAHFALPNGVFGVFDGVGGHPGSEAASSYVSIYCQGALGRISLSDTSSIEDVLSRILQDADRGLTHEYAESTARSIATTAILAALLWDEESSTGSLYTAHAGDSRAYLHRDGHIIFTTLDHSLTHALPLDEQRLIQDEIAKAHYVHDVDSYYWQYLWQRNIVTSSLKADYSHKRLRIDTNRIDVHAGDTILLTSDGVHDNLTTDEIAAILTAERQPAWALVDAAQVRSREPREVTLIIDEEKHDVTNFRPKPDDMTAVVIRIPMAE